MLFLFSGTGNSFAVAKRIHRATGLSVTDIATLVRYERYTFDAKGEDVGFVFPTYFCGLPRMVAELASNIVVRNPGNVFAVATCGRVSGGACDMLAELLGNRLKIDAMYDVVMPDNAVFYMDAPTEEQAKRILEEADPEMDRIAESVAKREKGDFRKHRGNMDWREVYREYDEFRRTDRFRVTDACIKCRICEELCSEQIIMFYHRTPVWDEEKCSLCMGCIQICPKRAIQYGDVTENRGRYRHPLYYERELGLPFRYDEQVRRTDV